MTRRPPRSTLFPSTTLFRSISRGEATLFLMEATMHGDGASLFVAQRLNSDAHPPMRSPSTKPETVPPRRSATDRKSTRLNSSHDQISYAVFCLHTHTKQPPA